MTTLGEIKTFMRSGKYTEGYAALMNLKPLFHTLPPLEQCIYYEYLALYYTNVIQQLSPTFIDQYRKFAMRCEKKHHITFRNYEIIQLIFNDQRTEALGQYLQLIEEAHDFVEEIPSTFASILANTMSLLSSEARNPEAIDIYNNTSQIDLQTLYEAVPISYYHIHENLLYTYINVEQYTTAAIIAEMLFENENFAQQSPYYYHSCQLAYGMALYATNRQKGIELIDHTARYFQFDMPNLTLNVKKRLESILSFYRMQNDIEQLNKYKKLKTRALQ